MYMVMSLLPYEDIEHAFSLIIGMFKNNGTCVVLAEFLTYVNQYWMIRIDLYECFVYGATMRTNNGVEASHYVLMTLLCVHPLI